MNKLAVIIVEDEVRNQKFLTDVIKTSFPDLEILGIAGKVTEAVDLILSRKPELILLDIQLKDGTGFDVLEKIPEDERPSIIFTTAYDQYALEAFRYSAVNYLLKPIDREELRKAVDRVQRITKSDEFAAIRKFVDKMVGEKPGKMITISGLSSTEYIKISDIIHIEAMGAYSKVFIANGTSYTVSKVIKKYDEMLAEHGFFRVHQSHLINLNFVKSLNKGDSTVELSNGTQVGLSRKRKEEFILEMKKRMVS